MRKLKTFEFISKSVGPYAKYDWDRLLDGDTWKISAKEANPREGEDERTTIVRFRRHSHAAAQAR